jgi:hypothetical protein
MQADIIFNMDLTVHKALAIIECLDEKSLTTTLTHVQLERKVVVALKNQNIVTLNDFLSAAKDSYPENQVLTVNSWLTGFWNRFWTGIEVDSIERIQRFALASMTGNVDWLFFWESIDYDFRFAAAKLDEVFKLDNATKSIDINALGIGKTGLLLKRNGIQNVGDLIPLLAAGLPDYSGFGKSKVWEFACGIRDFIVTIDENRTHSSLATVCSDGPIKISYRGDLQYVSINGSKMSEATRKLPLTQFNLRKEIKKLNRIGVFNISQLFELFQKGLPDIKGVGLTARINLYNAVQYADLSINDNGNIDWRRFAELSGSVMYSGSEFPLSLDDKRFEKIDYRGILQYCSFNGWKMSEATKRLPLSQFNLRKEIKKLDQIGVRNIWQLFELFEKGLPEIKSVGKTARINLYNAVKHADLSLTEDGTIDWIKFAELSSVKVIPKSGISLDSGDKFLGCLDQVIVDIAAESLDKVESQILLQRLISDRRNALTLEQIAERFNITRERVRQKQEGLLDVLSSALLDNEYEGISFRFSDNFSSYWQAAVRHLGSQQSLGYFEFIDGLTKVWGVTENQVRPHFKFIYSILTNESSLPIEYSIGSIVPFAIFQITNVQELNRSILSFHPSRTIARSFARVNVKTIKDLLNVLRLRSIPLRPNELNSLSSEILVPLSNAVTQQGLVDWEKYCTEKGIKLVPAIELHDPINFVDLAVESVLEFIRATPITGRSEVIFINRIVPDAERRKTLAATGEELGCFGPSIAREQTDLLRRLYDAIYCSDYTDSKVHFRDSFVQKWFKSKTISQQTKAVPYFAELLGLEWELPFETVMKIAPMLVSVIKGRPIGYTGREYSVGGGLIKSFTPNCKNESENQHTVIRLRGFRNIH